MSESKYQGLPIPLAAQIDCVRREIAMRERVYPRWVAASKMKAGKADQEIEAMRAVLHTLEQFAAARGREDAA